MSVRTEVENTLFAYAHAYDENDMDTLADCFTEDAQVLMHDGPLSGREAVRERLGSNRAAMAADQQPRHVIGTVVLESESPAEVRARAYLIFSIARPGSVEVVTTAVYHDRLVLEGDRWRIAERSVKSDIAPRE